jgi:hypothetical protein
MTFLFSDQPEDSDEEGDDEDVKTTNRTTMERNMMSVHEQPDIDDIIQPEPFLPVFPEDIDVNEPGSDVSYDGKLLRL